METSRSSQIRAAISGTVGLVLLAGVLASCDTRMKDVLVPNTRPIVQLSVAPLPQDSIFYSVRFEWFAFDEDGQVERFIYAVDPPASGDTVWTSTRLHQLSLLFRSGHPREPLSEFGTVTSSDYHTFVIKAVDNQGMTSAPVFRSFTSFTVAPQTQIEFPPSRRLLETVTHPSLTIRWSGDDPDGVTTHEPVQYKFKIASEATIQQALGLGSAKPFAADIQQFFSETAPTFASWDSVPPDSAFKSYEFLIPGQRFFFAVTAFDEAGAYEPRFLLGNNVLRFLASANVLPPKISVSSAFFSFEQLSGGFDLSERNVVHLDFGIDQALVINWSAEVQSLGSEIRGYRWVMDPPDQDIFDETPRDRDDQTWRWSSWSLNETSARVGPFKGLPDEFEVHRFYIEARDNGGLVSLVIIELRVLTPIFDRPLLIFDDFRGRTDRVIDGDPNHPDSFQPYGEFPTEAILDTLMYAVGGFPYKKRPPGTMSVAGVFAGFAYDTLDYRFDRVVGIPLDLLFRYRAVVIYTGIRDAVRTGVKSPISPPSALAIPSSAVRAINRPGEVNTLGVYLAQGGKVWMFGDGSVLSMVRGQFGQTVRFPIDPGPGSFPYEFLKARSRIGEGGRGFDFGAWFVGAIPYLPEFATPGRPWPPEATFENRGALDDPRVGPSAERNRLRWDGLPALTLTSEFADWPSPLPSRLGQVDYLALPNEILEDLGGAGPESVLDTLYLYRSRDFDPSLSSTNADGRPVMLSYRGAEHGPVVWTGAPLWHFERTQLQELADLVLGSFGFTRSADLSVSPGPGSAHRFLRTDPESSR